MCLSGDVTPGAASQGGSSLELLGFESSGFESSGSGVGLLEPPTRSKAPAREPRLGGGSPPDDGDDDGGGGGGGGGGGDDSDDEGERHERKPVTVHSGALGLGLLLVSITTLFVVFLTAFVLTRSQAPEWPPADTPSPPLGLWLSTAVLLASSATVAQAVRSARRGERGAAIRGLVLTLVLGALFLVVQGLLWSQLVSSGFFPSSNGYGAVFYALTGLHAAHIIGGLVYLGIVATRLRFQKSSQAPVCSIPLAAAYWHYMGGIWIVLFGALYT